MGKEMLRGVKKVNKGEEEDRSRREKEVFFAERGFNLKK